MNTFQRPIALLFILYFLVLFCERAQSLVRIFLSKEIKAFGSGFDIYVNTLSIVSLLSTFVLLGFFNKDLWLAAFANPKSVDWSMAVITSGVILFSGMVHTEFTIPPVQFVSYGFLIAAMVLQTIVTGRTALSPVMLWYSLVYCVILSMAIPVVYRSEIRNAKLFHIIEALVSIALVVCFTYKLLMVFQGRGENLLLWIPFLIVAIGDALVLAMRWKESINSFVLIFSSLTVVAFVVGKIMDGRV